MFGVSSMGSVQRIFCWAKGVCLDNFTMQIFTRMLFPLLFWSTAATAVLPLVAIDVGHSLADSGAHSARGRGEFAFNREFAGVLAAELRQRGWPLREVNFAGEVRSLTERPAQAAGSDFFLSIHHDSISAAYLEKWLWQGHELSHTVMKRGFGLFVSAQNPDLPTSLRCARAMGEQLRLAGFIPSPWHGRKHLAADADNGVWYYDNLVVLYRTSLPAVLFEAGVIKHREEELELLDPQRQAVMAAALADGLADCLDVREKSAPE